MQPPTVASDSKMRARDSEASCLNLILTQPLISRVTLGKLFSLSSLKTSLRTVKRA